MRAQPFPPGYVDPQPLLAAAAKEIGEANLKCITFSGTGYGGAVGQTFENAVNVDWPRIDAAGQLHAHHQLGRRDQQGDLRPQAGAESRVVEVRPGLARRHASTEADAADPHRQRRACVAHRRRRVAAGGRVARGRGAVSARPLAQPARVHQGGAPARAPTPRPSGDGSRSRWAATATSSCPRRCTSSRSPCSASTASRPRSTRATRSSGSRRRSTNRRWATSISSRSPPSR